jgi:hypothetical protein
MKKQILLLAMTFGASAAFAQDLTSKKGEQILPEAGDWSIGVDATPFLQYMGNFFGKSTSNTAPTFSFLAGQSITGKYFVDPQTAYRGTLRIGLRSNTQRSMVEDRLRALDPTTVTSYPTVDPLLENSWKHSNTDISLSAGIEKRKGKTRLQGYYGGEAGISFSSSKDVFAYGNALSPSKTGSLNVIVDPDDAFTGGSNIVTVPSQGVVGSGRVTERKNGATFAFGVRGFVGVEYFLLPKISLGGEFGWGLGIGTTGKTVTTIESVGTNDPAADRVVGSTVSEGAKGGAFFIDTDNRNSMFGPSGSLRLNFHF